jgi:ABC-type uncharacterized transport system substrate-binding protein
MDYEGILIAPMRRFCTIAIAIALAVPLAGWAQGKVHKVGLLAAVGACRLQDPADVSQQIVKALAAIGCVERKNVSYVPRASRVAFLFNPDNPGQTQQRADHDAAAAKVGIKPLYFEVRGPSDFDAVFTAVLREKAQAMVLQPLRTAQADSDRILQFAAKHGIPTMGIVTGQYIRSGALFFYAQNLAEQFGQIALYVDKILKGAKPGDLPVELPTKWEFVVNMKTAKRIGLTIPQSLLLQADRVIE